MWNIFTGSVHLQKLYGRRWRKGLTGVEKVVYEMMMYGIGKIGKDETRVLWLLVNCVKESLWDVRNILILGKNVSG